MSLIVCNIQRHILLRTYQSLINEGNTGDPVTIRYLAMALNIILATREVPHKVTPVHEIQLIGEEETQVLREGRLHHGSHLPTTVELHRRTFHLRPLFVSLHVGATGAVHTGEKHIQLIHILILRLITRDVVAILLLLVLLDDTTPSRFALLRNRDARTSLILTLHLRHVGLSVEQRSLTILLTCQIGTQCEDVLRSVLVHRRIGCRTYQGQGIRRVTHHNHQKAHQDRIQHLDINLFAGKQKGSQRNRQDHCDEITTTNERNTQ